MSEGPAGIDECFRIVRPFKSSVRAGSAMEEEECASWEAKSSEAYATPVEAIGADTGEPSPANHYVLGRIAESWGMAEAALAEYRQVKELSIRRSQFGNSLSPSKGYANNAIAHWRPVSFVPQ
jgi:hypothetical protein